MATLGGRGSIRGSSQWGDEASIEVVVIKSGRFLICTFSSLLEALSFCSGLQPQGISAKYGQPVGRQSIDGSSRYQSVVFLVKPNPKYRLFVLFRSATSWQLSQSRPANGRWGVTEVIVTSTSKLLSALLFLLKDPIPCSELLFCSDLRPRGFPANHRQPMRRRRE